MAADLPPDLVAVRLRQGAAWIDAWAAAEHWPADLREQHHEALRALPLEALEEHVERLRAGMHDALESRGLLPEHRRTQPGGAPMVQARPRRPRGLAKELYRRTTTKPETPMPAAQPMLDLTPEPPARAPYQVMPDLTPDEYADLLASIKAHGVLVPVEYDEAGAVLDGHHRIRACMELGITDWPRTVRTGLDEAGKRAHARTVNLMRRHLTREQRRQLIAAQLADTPEKSDRQIGQALGVSPTTVGAVRADLEESGIVSKLDRRAGADGKTRKLPEKPAATRVATAQRVERLVEQRVRERLDQEVRERAKAMVPDVVARYDELRRKATAELRSFALSRQGIRAQLTEEDWKFLLNVLHPDRAPADRRERFEKAFHIVQRLEEYVRAANRKDSEPQP